MKIKTLKKLKYILIFCLCFLLLSACGEEIDDDDDDDSDGRFIIDILDNSDDMDIDTTDDSSRIDTGEETEVKIDDTANIEDNSNDSDTSDNDTSDNNTSDNDTSDDDSTDNSSNDDDSTNEEQEDTFVSENHDAIQELVSEKYALLESDDSYEKTHDVYEINKQIAELNCYDFSDTTITFLGDSITYGQGGDYNQYGKLVSYVDYVRDILGCKTHNLAVPGAMIGTYNGYDGICYKVDLIPEDTDIIVVFGGVNDFFNGDSTYGDDSYSKGTFTGDAKNMFDELKEKYPDIPVYVITVYKNKVEAAAQNTIPLSDYMLVIRALAMDRGFRLIDLYKYDLMDNNVFQNFANYFDDTIHPNNNGYMWLGRYVAAEIVEDYN